MFVDHLLAAHDIQHDDEVVKALHQALDLEAVHQMYDDLGVALAYIVEESVLQIGVVLLDHNYASHVLFISLLQSSSKASKGWSAFIHSM